MLKFDINILWTLINLIIFFVLMKLFLFKPIKKTLDKRKELIEGQFKAAEDKEKKAGELQASMTKSLHVQTTMQLRLSRMLKRHLSLKAKRHVLQLSRKLQSLLCRQQPRLLKRKFLRKQIKCSTTNF